MSAVSNPSTSFSWQNFCGARLDYLKELAVTVEHSFLRRDTAHPVFCGCIDWHSSVHGAFSLLMAARLTGQLQWAQVVEEVFQPDRLAAELDTLRQGELHHELPYGYAWFLRLAREWEAGWGKTDLRPLATDMANRLRQWIVSLSDEAVIHYAHRREYGNLSWALLNLWQWGNWNEDGELVENLVMWTRLRLLPIDPVCPPALDQGTDEFFAPALQRCRVLLSLLPAEESMKWWTMCDQGWRTLSPVTTCFTTHAAGLNFSRSWGFWTIYQQTQDLAFRDLYVQHILTHMGLPQYWRDDYRKYGHWVPQFGIYAIALSFGDGAGYSCPDY